MRRLLAALALMLAAAPAAAEEGLHAQPTLALDPGFHTAMIRAAAIDARARYVVTGADDKTVRVFDLATGRLQRTIRVPAGPHDRGKVYAVALSPDGELIAASGGGERRVEPGSENAYLFERASGRLVLRLAEIDNVVRALAFSADGRFLAATLYGPHGLRIFDRERGWSEVARDTEYGASSYGVAFSTDGRVATTSWDGRIRLYAATFERMASRPAPGGEQPFHIAFDPAGERLAVGYHDTPDVSRHDAVTLERLPGDANAEPALGNRLAVDWARHGSELFAAGTDGTRDGTRSVRVLAAATGKPRAAIMTSRNTVMSVKALPEGDLLVAAADPWLARLRAWGTPRWLKDRPQADLRGPQFLRVNLDGTLVDFRFSPTDESFARFDVAALALSTRTATASSPAPGDGKKTVPPSRGNLRLRGIAHSTEPRLEGEVLELMPSEIARSVDAHPSGERFVLGASWSLRAFDAAGIELWRRPVPGPALAVNVTGDGRLVVVAYHDGTIRWHRMDDGRELLAFFPMEDRKNWVLWSPDGFYAATPGARGVLRWHVNRGWDEAAKAVPVENMPLLHRPDALRYVLQEMDIVRALGLADLNAAREQIVRETGAAIAPGAKLHVLAVGVSEYGEAATHLNLEFADDDARDVAAALTGDPGGLYAEVRPQLLRDDEANKLAILRGLDAIRTAMAASADQRDLAVVFFSGHGAVVNDNFYLLPHGVNADDPLSLATTGLAIDEFRRAVRAVAAHGRVLLLLDACRAGAATADGRALEADARRLRTALVDTNVSVLTSSRATELSREYAGLANGAFTEALLDALGRRADANENGLLSLNEITEHLRAGLARYSGGRQEPGVEIRFPDDVFAAGL